MAWIAVDVGTSRNKEVAFVPDDIELAVARRHTEVLHSESGWSEQKRAAVCEAVVSTVRKVSASGVMVTAIISAAQGD